MTFGDPKQFAIEAYHEPHGPQYAGFGRLCIRVAGIPIGDIRDNHCSLFHATDRFRELIQNVDTLWNESFAGLSDAEIFGIIDRDLYIGEPSDSGPSYSNFDFLTNTGEMFDGTKTFIFGSSDGQVHVLCRFRDDSFRSGLCSIQAFRATAEAYIHWFDEQVRTVGPPYFPINPFDLNEKVPENGNG
ncbi:MAG: hypothetical protein ACXWBP_10055 [Limisphaerales bacterium]